MKRVLTIACFLFSVSLLAQNAILGTEAQQKAGKVIYDAKCAQCHGYNGDAKSVGREYFRPQPRDFTAATFKFRSTASGELPTHEDLKRSIRLGMPYTGMPAWPEFSDAQLNNLAYYIKTFAEDFIDYGDVKPVEIPDLPSFDDARLERGRVVYEENQCLDCHGEKGRGDGPSATTLKDQWEEPIRPADLTKPWTWRGGAAREDIVRTFNVGLDGSPMPAYNIEPFEDQLALVDYVHSLRPANDAPYANYATAVLYDGEIVVSEGASLFSNAPGALFPIVGQVVEPGRAFFPGVNAVEVKAVYNEDDIAIGLFWNDMAADRQGSNNPGTRIAAGDAELVDPDQVFSDAVAVLIPAKHPTGQSLPYFMLGDKDNPMDIWYADLAGTSAAHYVGKGSNSLSPMESDIDLHVEYSDGQWMATFKRKRVESDRFSFTEGKFHPVAFSIWDGTNKERGNKRGLTSWYYLYLEPMEKESSAMPMAKWGLFALLAELALVGFVRLKKKQSENV